MKTYGNAQLLELFSDVIILLAQLVETQNMDVNKSIYLALKNCLKNFGIVIQVLNLYPYKYISFENLLTDGCEFWE